MRLEHVGIAVRDAEATIALLHTLLGARPYKSESVASEGVLTVFFDAGGPRLELLEAQRPDSPIAGHLERRGEGLHHLAFEVDDIDAAFERLDEAGFRLLNDAPKPGADGMLIFFVHPKDAGGVLVELCQSRSEGTKSEMIDVGRRRIAAYHRGRRDAPPVVLLHAAAGSAELELQRLARAIEPHFRVVAVDLAGHGRSDDIDRAPSLELFADDVAAVLDQLKLERAHLFGYSLGGAVALTVAIRHPHRVDRAIVHATTTRWDRDEAATMAESLNPVLISEAHPPRAERLAEVHGPDRWQALCRQMASFVESLPERPILDDDLSSIARPFLVSHGDLDRFIRLDRALHLWRTLPDARLAVHPGVDHALHRADIPALSSMLQRFLLAAGE